MVVQRPIRVCYMIDRLARAGTESQLLALIAHLDWLRVEPTLCLLDGRDAASQALEPTDCVVWRLGIGSLHRWETVGKVRDFVARLRAAQIDVLQLYFPESTYIGAIAGRLARTPCILRTQNNLGYWMSGVDRALARLCDRLIDGSVANCALCRDAALTRGGSRRGSVVVVENGVDVDRFARVASSPRTDTRLRVGMVANLRPVKCPALFIEAASRIAADFPHVNFELAGEGELRPKLERQIADAGLADRVRLVGERSDVADFLAGLDVAVSCSESEGLSNVILEYMAAGKAVAATAVGAATDSIEPGVDGLLIPPHDAAALAGALSCLLSDPARRQRMGCAVQVKVRRRYCHEARAGRFAELYAELIFHGRNVGTRRAISLSGERAIDVDYVVRVTGSRRRGCSPAEPLRAYQGRGPRRASDTVHRVDGPVVAGDVVGETTFRRDRVLQSCAEFMSLFPGVVGVYLRRGYYAMTLDRFSWDCGVGFGTTFAHRRVDVGRGVSIGNHVTLGQCVLEDDVLIGSNVDILSGRRQHEFSDDEVPVQYQARSFTPVRVGRNSWLGNSSVIMADVGPECVIGAGSVVVRPIPSRSVAVGNPAQVKKQRPAAEDQA